MGESGFPTPHSTKSEDGQFGPEDAQSEMSAMGEHPLANNIVLQFKAPLEENLVAMNFLNAKHFGMKFTTTVPGRVSAVLEGSSASLLGVRTGWRLVRIGQLDVENNSHEDIRNAFSRVGMTCSSSME